MSTSRSLSHRRDTWRRITRSATLSNLSSLLQCGHARRFGCFATTQPPESLIASNCAVRPTIARALILDDDFAVEARDHHGGLDLLCGLPREVEISRVPGSVHFDAHDAIAKPILQMNHAT